MWCENIKVILLIIGVIVTASIEHITIPIFVTEYPSIYFILLMTSVQGTFFYIIGFLILKCKNAGDYNELPPLSNNFLTIVFAGITNALMSMFLAYSANPIRTPVVVQSIFLGLAIIPSIIFTKAVLKKKVNYDYFYSSMSMIFLLSSIIVACIPIYLNTNHLYTNNMYWILLYLLGVIFLSLANILQEKYIIVTSNHTLINKFRFASIMSCIQIICLLMLCWMDIYFGYFGTPSEALAAFVQSFLTFFSDAYKMFLIELFVLDILVLFIFSIYLNAISTNYNMILTNLTNQSVALFFLIFPHLNHGIKYPMSVTMLSLTFNISSIILWVRGEKRGDDNNKTEFSIIMENINKLNYDTF